MSADVDMLSSRSAFDKEESRGRSDCLPLHEGSAVNGLSAFGLRDVGWARVRSSWVRASSGVGTRTMLHTCLSPPSQAASTRSIPSASSRSVLARRERRFTRILVGEHVDKYVSEFSPYETGRSPG